MRSFNLEVYLKERRSLVDRALARCLEERKQRPRTLYSAMHYSLFTGGKRLRPILMLAVGDLFGGKKRVLLPFACAVELIHTYSIIHDDLPALDDDDVRRGEPTNHKVFGEGIALLAGDALLTEAFHLMSRPQVLRALPAEVVLDVIHEISHASGIGGLVGGQAVDLEAEGQKADRATVEYIHVRKTGALIVTAARIGGRLSRAKPREMRRISRYAEFLGLAFQIADDILDGNGHPSADPAFAKKEGRKATYPSIVGLAPAKARARELLQHCVKALDAFGEEADPLRELAHHIVGRAV